MIISMSKSLTSVGEQDREPPVSNISSVPVLVDMSLDDILSEASVHEMEVNVLVRGRSGVGDETL